MMYKLEALFETYSRSKVENCIDKYSELQISFEEREDGYTIMVNKQYCRPPTFLHLTPDGEEYNKTSVDTFLRSLNRIIDGKEKIINKLRDCIQS